MFRIPVVWGCTGCTGGGGVNKSMAVSSCMAGNPFVQDASLL